MNKVIDDIDVVNGYNILILTLPKDSGIIIEPTMMIHMNGNLNVEGIVLSQDDKFFSKLAAGLRRKLTGSSFYNSLITNRTNENLKITLGPHLTGGITKLEILPNEVWKFKPGSFMACTSNLLVSGNLNIFSNFKAAISGQSSIYTEISSNNDEAGTVWVSSYGGIEKHEIQMGDKSEKLYINDGCFLGMLSENKKENIKYWDHFVSVGSANGFLKGLFTDTALLLKIEDKKLLSENNNRKCKVYTQSLNKGNLENYIRRIGQEKNNKGGVEIGGVEIFGGENKEKYEKYEEKYNKLIKINIKDEENN